MKRALLSVLLAVSLLGLPAESTADQLARTREAVRPENEGDPDEPHVMAPAGTNFAAPAPDAQLRISARGGATVLEPQDLMASRLLRWVWRLIWPVL